MEEEEKEIQAYAIEKAIALMEEMNQKLVEREELIGLVILALFSAQNMFLIGKPGVAKTKVLKLALGAIEKANTFEHLMMYDTKPEACFGTSVISPNGEVIHQFDHSAITAHYIFEDEFFKGSSEVINGYLGITSQDREYHPGGMAPIKVPLLSFFAASNEFPSGEVLNAMNDRLPLRYEVQRIYDDENFCRMVEGTLDTSSTIHNTIPIELIQQVAGNEIQSVTLPRVLSASYAELKWKLITEENIEASDRRLSDAVRVMKASAYLNFRNSIDESDFFILNHIIWNDFTERKKTQDGIKRHFFGSLKQIELLIEEAESAYYENDILKQNYLNAFLNKSQHVILSELESYYLKHMAILDKILKKLEQDYVIIDKIDFLYKENKRIHSLLEENIFIQNYEDDIFSVEVLDKIDSIRKGYQNLFLYLMEFKKSCPSVREYKSYTGKKID